MRTIEISDEVWDGIAKHGKFGETEDDVLRRILGVPPQSSEVHEQRSPGARRPTKGRAATAQPRFARTRLSSFVQNGTLVVAFTDGARKTFALPGRDDKLAIRRVRDEAVQFAKLNGASYGQEMAVKKALTEAGYHLMK